MDKNITHSKGIAGGYVIEQEAENDIIASRANKAGLSRSTYARYLLLGYMPKEKPDERFHDVMNELSNISDGIKQIAQNVSSNKNIDVPFLLNEAEKWRVFRMMVKREFLEPEKLK
jgi:hypothetical protein